MTEDEKMKKYENFFEEIKKFQEKQKKQKQSGLNDYNLLTVVLEPHDEVRLHSRMIGSLLNPDGLHYQNTLFLENFIDEIKLDDFELDLENIYVGVEYRDIDIYITDGTKHIIIENKIWAGDQSCQIIKYINIIVEENKNSFFNPQENDTISKDLLRVVYLTPQNKDLPDEHIVEEDYISFNSDKKSNLAQCSEKMKSAGTIDFDLKNYKVKYKKINYKDIVNWLQKCKHEVQNITNLNEAIRQYIDVVKMINKDYEGKVMQLENEFLKNNEYFEIAKDIKDAYFKALNKRIESILSNIDVELKDQNMEVRKNSSSLDIDANQYFIRILFNKEQITIQIGSKEDYGFKNKIDPDEKKELLKNLKNIHNHFNGGWSNSYAVLTFQEEDLLKDKAEEEIKMVITKLLKMLKSII